MNLTTRAISILLIAITTTLYASKTEIKSSKETFVLVHSAWLGAWQWQNVTEYLTQKGHQVIVPDLSGHGQDNTAPKDITMSDYIKKITSIIDQQDQKIILVGHSFNGITISQIAELRPKKIKSLVYLTAFLLPNGGSFFKAVSGVNGSQAVENFYLSEDQTYALVAEDALHSTFAHDISESDFNKDKQLIVPEPAAPLAYELKLSAKNFGKLPKYYIECTEDRAIPIAVQRAIYKDQVVKSYSLKSSHTPNFSQPKKLAKLLVKISKKH